MKRNSKLKKRALAVLTVLSLFVVGVIIAADTQPKVHIRGLELKKMDDGSVQARVSISVSNLQKASGINDPHYGGMTVTLQYNDAYMEPSDWYTNKTYGVEGLKGDGTNENGIQIADPINQADPLHHLFFHTNEDLFGGTYSTEGVYHKDTKIDPLLFITDESTGTAQGMANAITINHAEGTDFGQIVLDLRVRGYARGDKTAANQNNYEILKKSFGDPEGDNQTNGHLVMRQEEQRNSYTGAFYLLVGDKEELELGTLSFRIKSDTQNIADLEKQLKALLKFNGTDGTTQDDMLIVCEELVKEKFYQYKYNGNAYQKVTLQEEPSVEIDIDSDDVIVSAEPVLDDITINSYEAFTNGDIGDLALAMQKYAQSVRVKYVSGKQADKSIYWGEGTTSSTMPADGPGMLIQRLDSRGEAVGNRYRFTWTGTGYTLEEETSAGTFGTPTTPFDYDPRGGTYQISQYYTYWEKDGSGGTGKAVLKTLPTPIISVKLTVTPIKVIGASVDKQQITYRNHIDEVPQAYSGLELATSAKLTLDTTLNGVVPTMSITWTPNTLAGATTTVTAPGNPTHGSAAPSATWPVGQTAITAKTGVGDYSFTTTVLETDIRAAYPWLTTSVDYPLESLRRIEDVPLDSGGVPATKQTRYVMTARPVEQPLGSEIAQLEVIISKQEQVSEDNWVDVDMFASGTQNYHSFKLFMPNGQEIVVDPNGWFGAQGTSSTAVGFWYDSVTQAQYTIYANATSTPKSYKIVINPGMLGEQTNESHYTERETLRRYINLGGWFSTQVQEPNGTSWSDTITAYSKPRTNVYTKSYVENPSATNEEDTFDYTGDRSGLIPFYVSSDLPTFVTLPADDEVETRYDAFTGAQPGKMNHFKVEPSTTGRWTNINGTIKGTAGPNWTAPTVNTSTNTKTVETVTYGADLFASEYAYSDFGTIYNPDSGSLSGYSNDVKDRKVTVKVEVQDTKTLLPDEVKWGLTLTYEQNAGDSILYTTDNEVRRVTFNTKQEGYTYEQIVTLTLTNTGNQEIRDIYVDIPTLAGADGPYFKLVTAPPSTLPAGAKATFQISYVPNLAAEKTYKNFFQQSANDGNEPIHIYYSENGTVKTKDFEALLKVTKKPLNKVTIVVHPNQADDGSSALIMGDANLVEGITSTGTGAQDTYSGLAATSTYIYGETFWVLTTPKDEYSLITTKDGNNVARTWVYYVVDGDPTKHYLNEYKSAGTNAGFGTPTDSFVTNQENEERLFWIEMPDQPVTVHVHYYEPLYSKLRLSDLHAYAWDDKAEAQATTNTQDPAAVWVSPVTNATRTYNTDRELHLPDQANHYPAVSHFQEKEDEYIVFLDDEDSGLDNFCGVSVQLRKLETHINGVDDPTQSNNVDISPSVIMQLDTGVLVCKDGTGSTTGTTTSTAVPTVHQSEVFNAPVEDSGKPQLMAKRTVTILISYDLSGDPFASSLVPAEEKVTREYKVHFVRRMKDSENAKHIAMPGNSPYGMIENDQTITDKTAAKQEFNQNNRFVQGSAYLPKRAAEAKLYNIYWPEAWSNADQNYDRNEEVIFAYIGENFYDSGAKNIYNNAGDYIDGIDVKRTLEYVQMNTSKTSAGERFTPTTTVKKTVDLGTVPAVDGVIPGGKVTITTGTGASATTNDYDGMVNFGTVTDIRPGIYKLTYTYTDWDGTSTLSFTRPLVVLPKNGDVNADQSRVEDDAKQVQTRFTTALPFMDEWTADSTFCKSLYRYRVVDANNDRNINNVDANMIKRNESGIREFYRPKKYTNPVKS